MDTATATEILGKIRAGDPRAVDALLPALYSEFRALAHRYLGCEGAGHTLQTTALVNEAYLRLIDQSRVDWQGKTHFLAVGAQAMRRVLVDHARARGRHKRGGGRQRVPLEEGLSLSAGNEDDVLAVDEAIVRLAAASPRQAQIVEMRFFAGMTVEEVAAALGVSKRTIENDWTHLRAWLRRELGAADREP